MKYQYQYQNQYQYQYQEQNIKGKIRIINIKIFLLIIIFNINFVNSLLFPYNLWGKWNVNYQFNNKNKYTTDISIYSSNLQINKRQELLGGIIIYNTRLTGSFYPCSDLNTKTKKIIIKLYKKNYIINSIFGIKINIQTHEIKKKIRGSMYIDIIDYSDDIIIFNLYGTFTGYLNKKQFALTRINNNNIFENITPLNLILITQFVGFITTHFYDSLLDILINILQKIK